MLLEKGTIFYNNKSVNPSGRYSIINIYVPEYMKQKLSELRGGIDNVTIV